MEIKKGKIVGSYLSFINLNLIVEFGRTAIVEILNILFLQYFYCRIFSIKKRTALFNFILPFLVASQYIDA